MATKATSKKGITVPKPKTVPMRKYDEMKAKYEALNDAHDGAKKKINEQAMLILKQAEEIRNLQPKVQDAELKSGMPGLGPIANQEFIVLDKIVNEVARLNPFQRKTVITGFLSSIKERMKYDMQQKTEQKINKEIEFNLAANDCSKQGQGMEEMAKIIRDFAG